MKNILVLLHDDEGQESRLQVALDLARSLSGHLIGLDVLVPPPVLIEFAGVVEPTMLNSTIDSAETNRTRLVERLEREDVPFSIQEAIGAPGNELTAASDLADLVVVTSRTGKLTPVDAKHTVSEVATKAHRPVVAVPPGCPGLNVAGKALVAWNGSRASNEALRAAVPLLQKAKSVTLLEVNSPQGDFGVNDAASYLSRNGIEARIVETTTSGPVSDAILGKAEAIDAAYVVMGSYGPGRAIEAMFGGVTAGILAKSELPVVLAH